MSQCSPEEPGAGSIILVTDMKDVAGLPSQFDHLQNKGPLSFFSLDEVVRYGCIDL